MKYSKELDIIKKNIELTIDKLVKQYNVKNVDLILAYENTEKLYEYTLSKNKIKEEDKIPMLILAHNFYLNYLYSRYELNNNYYQYPLRKDELEYLYRDFKPK
ncbi:MAG TPA: hypothetical protein V6C58_25545 [Allocoleopsis sp.]